MTVTATAAGTGARLDLTKKVKSNVPVKEQAEIKQPEIQSTSDVTVRPLQAAKAASVDRKTVLLYEDFDNVPDGATETIDKIGERYTDYIASHYYQPGRYIDNEYTPETGTWEGDWVMAGKGGTVILQCYNPQQPAQLNTPLGDFSGDLTVTVRCRFAKSFWGSYQSESGYVTTSAAELSLALFKGGYDDYSYTVTDAGPYSMLGSGQFYEQDNWQEVTFKVRNESADADGFLSFYTNYAVEIDWIKVTDDNTFLAAPVMRDATAFTNDGFTINWDPVRRTNNYYIDLWKTVYTAPEGVNVSADFENLDLPEWLTGDNVEVVEEMGAGGSTGIVLVDNGVNGGISTIDFGKKLDSFSFDFLMNLDMSNPAAIDYDNLPTLFIDVYGDNGWEPFGQIEIDGWYIYPGYYNSMILDGPEFEGMFTAVRFYAANTDEESLIHLDNFAAYAQRPFELERVKGPGMIYDPTDDDYGYNYYTFTNDADRNVTSYTFTELDPETEYWYRVRSHYMFEFAGLEKKHAFGVAAPELLPATNVTKTSYTANWVDAPKAQKYTVYNYKGTIIEADETDHTMMAEAFSKCTGSPNFATLEPLGNPAECDLSEYTDNAGWRGKNNAIGQNYLGTENYASGYLITPPMMVNPARGTALVYVEITGMYGEYLRIVSTKSGLDAMQPFDEEGEIIGWLEIPAVEGDQIKFSTYYGSAFAFSGFEVVQDVKAGDVVRVLDSSAEVPAGEQAYTFDNLNGGFYAYSVVSHFNLERDNAVSTSSDFVTVDTETGNSNVTNKIELIGEGAEEVARYSVDGTKVGKDFKGMVIIEMNDGKVMKKVSK